MYVVDSIVQKRKVEFPIHSSAWAFFVFYDLVRVWIQSMVITCNKQYDKSVSNNPLVRRWSVSFCIGLLTWISFMRVLGCLGDNDFRKMSLQGFVFFRLQVASNMESRSFNYCIMSIASYWIREAYNLLAWCKHYHHNYCLATSYGVGF